MTDRLREAFRSQSRACAALGSPFMGRLMGLAAEHLEPGHPLTDRLFGWPGDVSSDGGSLPLRLAGALHGIVLEHPDDPLASVYPPHVSTDAALWRAVENALDDHMDRIDRWLNSPPQTNEVRRSVALIPATLFALDRHDRPLRLSELGASGGLNLNYPDFGLVMGDVEQPPRKGCDVMLRPNWKGKPPPSRYIPPPTRADHRAGVDLNPLNTNHEADRLRLRAYIWPDQPERLALTNAAIAAAPPMPERGDALPFLQRRLSGPEPGTMRVITHTIAWQYFPPDTQKGCRAAIEAAGLEATDAMPLAWIGMEADGNPNGARLTLRLWPGDETWHLARVDFHGRWIDWAPQRMT